MCIRSRVLLLAACLLTTCDGLGSRFFGLPGYYDRAYTTPVQMTARLDAWASHNLVSRTPLMRVDEWLGPAPHVRMPDVVFASAGIRSSVHPSEWRIDQRVPFVRTSDPSSHGVPAATGFAEWREGAIRPFSVGRAVGQVGIEAPGHQHSDGRYRQRIPFISNFLNH